MDVARVRRDLERERQRLGAERDRLDGVLADAADGRDADAEETIAVVLRQIELALARIDDGSYGTCAACGAAIAAGRLAALPYASRCAGCAETPA